LNTIAAGFVVSGLVVPAVAYGYHSSSYTLSIDALVWSGILAVVGALMHLVAQLLISILNT
jgi:hypothetical protein